MENSQLPLNVAHAAKDVVSNNSWVIYDLSVSVNKKFHAVTLKEHNILVARLPENCTDKLQPINISVNKAA